MTEPTPQAVVPEHASAAPARSDAASVLAPPARRGFWAGRSGLLVPALLAAFSTYLAVGNLTMHVSGDGDFPGPTFFPWLLAVAGYVVAALLVVSYLRSPELPVETSDRTYRTFSDWPAVVWCVGGFLVFALALEVLGWILAAALLFWCVARGIGSRRPLFDAGLALVFSSLVYLAFSVGLGLNLPSGLVGGGF